MHLDCETSPRRVVQPVDVTYRLFILQAGDYPDPIGDGIIHAQTVLTRSWTVRTCSIFSEYPFLEAWGTAWAARANQEKVP